MFLSIVSPLLASENATKALKARAIVVSKSDGSILLGFSKAKALACKSYLRFGGGVGSGFGG